MPQGNWAATAEGVTVAVRSRVVATDYGQGPLPGLVIEPVVDPARGDVGQALRDGNAVMRHGGGEDLGALVSRVMAAFEACYSATAEAAGEEG